MIEALRRLPGFERLNDPALELIIARSTLRHFAPGQLILPGGCVAEQLYGRIEGKAVGTGGCPVFDAPGLLFGLAARADICAGPTGLTVIAIAKPYVFTIVREFPEFVVSLLERDEQRQ